ncbi:MAG: class I SAM-dependent methyltransferase [Chitinophagaceae bacterium]
MSASSKDLIEALQNSLSNHTFVKLSLGNYKGKEDNLKAIYAKLVLIKKEQKISFTYRYKTNDIVKNYSFSEAFALLNDLISIDNFRFVTLYTTAFDLIAEVSKENAFKLNRIKPTHQLPADLSHDKQKNRKIEAANKPYLQELNIADRQGVVYKNAQDKFRQINHYIEILSSLLKALPSRDIINIVDMGAGKGYLTFALYDYVANTLNKPVSIVGVEFRKDLVNLCNNIAKKSNFYSLSFVQSSIEEYDNTNMNVLIALHACDTATDDAIYKGIKNNADLIVVAPCCHKQIRREIEKNKAKNELDFLIKHGIFLERQSEMVTDGLRALILEYNGYATKVFEFISDAHTPKNVLIVGEKKTITAAEKEMILEKIKSTKKYFGIHQHHLEMLCGL